MGCFMFHIDVLINLKLCAYFSMIEIINQKIDLIGKYRMFF